MRRTPEYFTQKLSNMYKSNVMDWLCEQLDDHDLAENWSARMYYQYDSLEEIQQKMRLGEVISGFTFKGKQTKMIVAYGK